MRIRRRTEPGHAHGIGNAAYLGKLALLAAVFYGLCFVIARQLSVVAQIDFAGDWVVYRSALQYVITGRDPYNLLGMELQFYNPPWALWFLLPFAAIPAPYDFVASICVGFVVYAYVCRKFGGSWFTTILFLTSLPVIQSCFYGQIDWLALVGLVLPPPIGLLFVALKPQVCILVGAYWAYEAWLAGGIRAVARLVAPLCVALLVTALVYGPWMLNWERMSNEVAVIWPRLLPVGFGLFVAAFKRGNSRYAIIASPCVSPHVWQHSYVGGLVTVVDQPLVMSAVWVGLWASQVIARL